MKERTMLVLTILLAACGKNAAVIRDNWERIAGEAPDAMTALQQIGVWYFGQIQRHPELLQLRSRSFIEAPDDVRIELMYFPK
jgi:hypothetical protein